MKKRLIISVVFGALLVTPMAVLTGCQSPNSIEPAALTGNTDTDQARASTSKSEFPSHRNWRKMRR